MKTIRFVLCFLVVALFVMTANAAPPYATGYTQGPTPLGSTSPYNPVQVAGQNSYGALVPFLFGSDGGVKVDIVSGGSSGGSGGAVNGATAIGSTPTTPPVFDSGIDPLGHIKALSLDTSGDLFTYLSNSYLYVTPYSGALWTLGTGSNTIGSIANTSFGVSSLPALPAGSNNIGSVTNITGTVSLPTGAATATNQTTAITNQTNGSQKTQVVDGSGNVITSTGNALNVSAAVTSSVLPTNAAQETGGNLATIANDMTNGSATTQIVDASARSLVLTASNTTTIPNTPAIPVALRDTAPSRLPAVTYPQTGTPVISGAGTVTCGAEPGTRMYATVQVLNINSGSSVIALGSVAFSAGATSITVTAPSVPVGAELFGTGIALGTYVTANSGTAISISIPTLSTQASTALTSTAFSLVGEVDYLNTSGSWQPMYINPLTTSVNSAPVNSIITPMTYWFYAPQNLAPASTSGGNMRLNITSQSGIAQLNGYIGEMNPGDTINLPFFDTTTWGTISNGMSFTPPIDCSLFSSETWEQDAFGGTSQAFTPYQTNDPLMNGNASALPAQYAQESDSLLVAPVASWTAGQHSFTMVTKNHYLVVKFSGTAITSNIVTGFTAIVGPKTLDSTVSTTNVTQVGGGNAAVGTPNGGTVKSLAVNIASGSEQTEVSAVNLNTAGAAGYSGSSITDTIGGGVSLTAIISPSISSWGTTTGIQVLLQTSPDAGTTWYTVWSSPMMTSSNEPSVIYMPPTLVEGTRRWLTYNQNNVAPTTGTLTIKTTESSTMVPPSYSFFDYVPAALNGVTYTFSGTATTGYSASASTLTNVTTANNAWYGMSFTGTNWPTGSFATAYATGATLTSSTFATATGSSITLTELSRTAPYLCKGCSNFRAEVTCGAITTTAGIYQIYIADTANGPWIPVGLPVTAVANSTVTLTASGYPANFVEVQCNNTASGQTGVSISIQAAVGAPAAPTATPAGTNTIGAVIGQRPFSATVTVTRPANTTAYTVGQLLSTATSGLTVLPTFALGVGNSQKVIINNVSIFSSNGSAGTKGQFDVYLFGVNNPSGAGFNDASTFAPTAAALSATSNGLLGSIATLLPNTGTASYGYQNILQSQVATTDSSGNVYLAIVLANAYTPASAETITVTLSGVY